MQAEQRDKMLAIVKAVGDKYPTLDTVPTSDKLPEGVLNVEIKGTENRNYIEAVYDLASRGAEVIARSEDSMMLFGAPAA